MNEAHQREAAIFDAAMDLPPAERAAHLDRACGNDAALRRRIESLLKADESRCQFLDSPSDPALRGILHVTLPFTEKPGDRIGNYKLLQRIGEGGCGVVYMAEQEEPVRRRVALKIIKLGMDTKSVIARFEAERQALALMDHPNIAKVLDAGATETGRPYFVMELVRGMKITEYCDEAKLSTDTRLDLFIQVCQAIQHAHQKGIIHRDIKPSNILVSVNDGVASPKVIDFGVAKATSGQQLTDKTLFTAFEQFIGTPAYMSPEQAVISNVDVDTRSDIYALGVLLYELLTGKTPFDAQELLSIGLDEMRRTIREQEPYRPSARLSTLAQNELSTTAHRRGLEAPKLVSELRGDLDWIVMKCLEKDRGRRYETANSLAADIQRHLSDEPVMACPPGKLYRLKKAVQRNKLAFAAGTAVAASLVIGSALSTMMFFGERAARQRADQQEANAREQTAIAEAVNDFLQEDLLSQAVSLSQADAGFEPDPDLTVREALDRAAERIEERFEDRPLQEAAVRHVIGMALRGVGEYERASAQLQSACDTRRAMLGPRHPDTLKSMLNLAVAHGASGKMDRALPLFEGALKLTESTLGPDHPDTLTAMQRMAEAYVIVGRSKDAMRLHEETLKRRKAVLGAEHRHTLLSMQELAGVYFNAGKFDLALPLAEESSKLTKAALGEDHPYTMGSMNILATCYLEAGKLAEATSLYEEILELSKAKLGPEDSSTLWAMNNLANAYGSAGEGDRALALHEETLKLRAAKLGPDHPDTLGAMHNLAIAQFETGHPDQGLSLLEETLKVKRAKLGPDHPETFRTITVLGGFYIDMGKVDKGVPLLDEALKLKNAGQGTNDPGTTGALAQAYYKAGKLDQALPLFEETVKLHRARLGPNHRDTLSSINNLAKAYLDIGKIDQALPFLEETLELMRATLPPDDSFIEIATANIALAYREAGKFDQVLPHFEEMLKLRKAKLGHDHKDTLRSMHDLAWAYENAGRSDQALPLWQEMFELRKARLGPDHPDTLTSMARVAECFVRMENEPEAESWSRNFLAVIMHKPTLGPDHRETLGMMNNLANAYRDAGKIDQALPILEKTLELMKATLSPDDSFTGIAMGNLVRAYHESGRIDRALPHFEGLLNLRKAELGDDHKKTLETMHELANLYIKEGKFDRGLPLLEEVLERRKANHGPNHPNTMHDLAWAYASARKSDQAIRLQDELVKLLKAEKGPEDPATLTAMSNLAIFYFDAGKLEQAQSLIEETSALAKSTLGPDHQETLRSMDILAAVYRKAGKRDQLETLYREQIAQQRGDVLEAKVELGRLLLERAEMIRGDTDRSEDLTREGERWLREYLGDVRSLYANSADEPLELAERLYGAAEPFYRQGNFAEAEPLYREIIDLRRPRLNSDDAGILEPTASLARLLSDWAWADRDSKAENGDSNAEIAERAREAERLLRGVLEVRLRDSPDSWRIGDSKSRLGGALVSVAVTDSTLEAAGRVAKLVEAESLLLEGHERLEKASDDEKYRRDALQRLVRLYEAWNKADKRVEWQKKLALLEQAQMK